MNSRERIHAIIPGRPADRCGLWVDNPHSDSWLALHAYFRTHLDLICGPAQFDQFIMPWFIRFTEQGHAHGYQVLLHSCGAIHRVIDRFITAGIDCLHPLQARAANMGAETLARDFKGRIAFMGGVDTQDLLVNGTPVEVRADVRRIKMLLGPRLIVSPSHEALLPNVPSRNLEALAEAAMEP